MKRGKIVFKTVFIIVALAISSFVIVYLSSINIYEPLFICFKGNSSNLSQKIKVCGISPLNKESLLQYDYKVNHWHTPENSYHKYIKIEIPDSIAKQIECVEIRTEDINTNMTLKDLILLKKTSHSCEYILPQNIKNKKAKIHKLFTIFSRWIPKNIIINIIHILFYVVLFSILTITIFKFISLTNKKNHTIKIRKNFLKWVILISFSVIIAFGLFYAYLLVTFFVTSHITSILFIIISGSILWLITITIIKLFDIPEKTSSTIKLSLLYMLFVWLISEGILRILSINKTYNEITTGYYASGFNNNTPKDKQNPHLLVYEKNTTLVKELDEFKYVVKSNADGLRDIDHPIDKSDNEYRIICLGNSFTEGMGAPQDSTCPWLLENKLKKVSNKKITVFNAGISGSDPFFEYMLLKERMLKYKPDLVIVALGLSDFNFYRYRGGFERFIQKGVQYRKGPWWEKIYAISYVFRFYTNNILNYKNKYLQSQSDYKADSIKANRDIEACVDSFYLLSLEKCFKLELVFIAEKEEHDRYSFLMQKLKNTHNIPFIDLQDYIKNIRNLSPDKLGSYYWKTDGHCNAKGYDLFAEGILWHLMKQGLIDSINNNFNFKVCPP